MKNAQRPNQSARAQTIFWVVAFGAIILFGLISLFVIAPAALAASPTATPTANAADHSAHHGDAATATPMSGMGGMGDSPTATPTANSADHSAHHENATTGTPSTAESGSGMGGMMGGSPMPGMDNMMSTHMPGMMGGTATPGMNMGGHDTGPVDASDAVSAPKDARGGQRLDFQLVNGVKEFKLNVQKVLWKILPDIQVVAYTYNGTVPGPEIRVTEGDRVRFLVTNSLKEPTVIHWHGMQIPNDQDGAADVTQPPIEPGETFTYEWTVPNTPGTFFYHTHFEGDKQQTLGLYGALIVEAKQPTVKYDAEYTVMLGEWTIKDGQTYPSMDMEGALPNYFTINGHSYPATDTLNVKVGQRVLIRFIGSGQFIHPMHLHGQPFQIVATDGYPVPEAAQLTKDTVLVGPGERYDVAFTARAPGKWLLHCHINHHITNNGQEVDGGGGLVMVVNVTP